MIAIQIGCATPLCGSLGHMGGLVFDGCRYVLPDQRRPVIARLGGDLRPVEEIATDRNYQALCYDHRAGCYWACAQGAWGCLYRLDKCFREVGRLGLSGVCLRHLCGLSCDPCGGALWLLFPDAIVQVDPDSGAHVSVPAPRSARLNLGILALRGGHVTAYLEGCRQLVQVECPGCGQGAGFCMPEDGCFEGMVLCGICPGPGPGCIAYEIALLCSRGCGRDLESLRLTVICCGRAVTPCPPASCHYGKYEALHSLALEEMGIAHMLNAEGEKIQTAVAKVENVAELLCVNRSVQRTLAQIAQLEEQLYFKLDALCKTGD